MQPNIHVNVLAHETCTDIPGRFPDSGLRELATSLGGHVDSDDALWPTLRQCLDALPMQERGEQLMDLVLLEPPIPAGCEAMLRSMQGDDPAWKRHDILADRLWLWYAHWIVSRTHPETFPAPTVSRVRVAVTAVSTDVRLPGKRTTPRDRAALMGSLLLARPEASPLSGRFGEDTTLDWAFDVLWSVEMVDREKPTAATLIERGATDEAANSGRLLTIVLDVYCDSAWLGDLTAGAQWHMAP